MVETELHHLSLVHLLLVAVVVVLVHMTRQLLLVVQVAVVQVGELLPYLYVQQELLIQVAVAVLLVTLIKQVLLVALVLLSFAILDHNVVQAAQSHHQAVIQYIHLHHQVHTQLNF
jgi:hypothetical protein